MAVAMLRPKPEKGGRGKKGATSGAFSVVPHQRIADARAVLSYSRELAEAVMQAEKPLQKALDEARLSQGSVRNERVKLIKLREERPDLAELVSTEAILLKDALKKAAEEAEERKQQRWAWA